MQRTEFTPNDMVRAAAEYSKAWQDEAARLRRAGIEPESQRVQANLNLPGFLRKPHEGTVFKVPESQLPVAENPPSGFDQAANSYRAMALAEIGTFFAFRTDDVLARMHRYKPADEEKLDDLLPSASLLEWTSSNLHDVVDPLVEECRARFLEMVKFQNLSDTVMRDGLARLEAARQERIGWCERVREQKQSQPPVVVPPEPGPPAVPESLLFEPLAGSVSHGAYKHTLRSGVFDMLVRQWMPWARLVDVVRYAVGSSFSRDSRRLDHLRNGLQNPSDDERTREMKVRGMLAALMDLLLSRLKPGDCRDGLFRSLRDLQDRLDRHELPFSEFQESVYNLLEAYRNSAEVERALRTPQRCLPDLKHDYVVLYMQNTILEAADSLEKQGKVSPNARLSLSGAISKARRLTEFVPLRSEYDAANALAMKVLADMERSGQISPEVKQAVQAICEGMDQD